MFWSLPTALVVSSLAAATSPAAVRGTSQDALQVEVDEQGSRLRLGTRAAFHATSETVADAREVALADGTRLFLWNQAADGGPARPWTAISLDGDEVDAVRETSYVLELDGARFDPLEPDADGEAGADTGSVSGAGARPALDPRLSARAGAELWLVQFVTQPLPAFRDALEERGARIGAYIESNAYLVRMSAEARAAVEALPFVRWVGAHEPAWRLEPWLRERLDDPELLPRRVYNVLAFRRADRGGVATALRALTGRTAIDRGARLLEIELTPEELVAAAALDGVEFIDRWTPYGEDMDLAREISGGNWFHDVLGLRGEGVRGEVMDSGLRQTHVDFTPAPLIHGGTPDVTSHGTNTYGIVFGDGENCIGGALPEGVGVFADYGLLGNRDTHTGELVDPAGPYRCVFQTNSWGSAQTSSYTTISADMDDILFEHDILIFQSQSNTGGTASRPQAWAKNIVAVGGVRHLDTLSVADDSWSGGASTGPATDGRLKPDLAHHYDSIATTTSSSNTACTSTFCCTSAATPVTAGHAGLWFQLWHTGIFGNTPGADPFESRPHMTLSKAMLIANASQWPFAGASHDLRRTHQGWGRIDVKNVHDNAPRTFWIDETDVLEPLGSTVHAVTVAAGTPALRVVLTWADPSGSPAVQAQHRVNDLDLLIVAPDTKKYYGNQGLDGAMWSPTGGVANDKDTVECVFVDTPLQGTWLIEIKATEVNQDGHVETGALDVDYALVVLGVEPVDPVDPVETLCFGEVLACPCGNAGTPGHGCENAGGTGGVALGVAALVQNGVGGGTFDLVGTGFPVASSPAVVAIRSTSAANGGLGTPFGDGLLCVAPPVVRISSTFASAGSMALSLSHGAGAGTFVYQLWYRSNGPFCSADTFNLSNAASILWP